MGLSHHECLIATFVVDFAEELVATLVDGPDLSHGQIEVDRKNHHFVLLDTHHDGEDHEARKDYEHTEENEG
jgi:hypothetical protein